MTSGLVVDHPADGVVRLLLHRPERRNALDAELVEALLAAFAPDPPAAGRVLVLGSSSPGVFCSGADTGMPDDVRAGVSDRLYELYERMTATRAIVLAALDGPAVGGGAQLAAAADLRVASPAAYLRFVGPGHGLAVGAWSLPSLVGRGRALDLCLTMRRVPAEEAAAIGLVDRIAEEPMQAALDLAVAIAALDGGAVARVKEVVRAAGERAGALQAERAGNAAAWTGSLAGARV